MEETLFTIKESDFENLPGFILTIFHRRDTVRRDDYGGFEPVSNTSSFYFSSESEAIDHVKTFIAGKKKERKRSLSLIEDARDSLDEYLNGSKSDE